MEPSDSVAIVSGGMDSTTLVYDMLDKGYTPHMLSFNYGQRHKKELVYAKATAKKLDLRHDIIDLSGLTYLISNSALTSSIDPLQLDPATASFEKFVANNEGSIPVPEGHYAEDTMKATVVPNRNMIMLAIAAGVAVNEKARTVGIGVHAGDHFVYPDCRPSFLNAMNVAISLGNEGFDSFEFGTGQNEGALFAPYAQSTKADIAFRAMELGVPFIETWSCYKGGEFHCGKCGTCVERLEAIDEAWLRYTAAYSPDDAHGYGHVQDGTTYEDKIYWRNVTHAE